MNCYKCNGIMQPIDESHWICISCGSIFPGVFKHNPELLQLPAYKEYPTMFENMLIAVLKANHLYAKRTKEADQYGEDLEIRKVGTDELIFYAEAEYDSSNKMFTENGEIRYRYINIPARKMHRFNRERPSVYVKGNIQRTTPIVFVLSGSYIRRFAKEPKLLECNFKGTKRKDWLYRFPVKHAKERRQLFIGPMVKWLEFVKRIYYFDSLIHGLL